MENSPTDERGDQKPTHIPTGLLETATSALLGGEVLVSFAPRGGVIAGSLGRELLARGHNMPATCREIIEKEPDEAYILYYDQNIPGINATSLSEALASQLESAANAHTLLFRVAKENSELEIGAFTEEYDDFVELTRISVAREFIFLFDCFVKLHGTGGHRDIIKYKSIYSGLHSYLEAKGQTSDASLRMAGLAELLVGEGPYDVESPPIIAAETHDISGVFADEGIDARGRVIVSVPGELPYIRPSGWMSDGRTVWRPGEGEFPFTGTHQGGPDTLRSRGRIFRRHLGEFIEGSVAEEVDYVLTASRAIQAFIAHGWPRIEGLSERGYNPFVRGPAAPIDQKHQRGQALPSAITGIDIEDLVGPWSFAGALRAYVTSRGRPPKPGTSFRDLGLSSLTLAVTHQDFADNDVLRAARRRLIGFLGPRVVMAPEVLRLCGFSVDPFSDQPLDPGLRSDPALILKLLAEDLEDLIRLRAEDREAATRGTEPFDLRRTNHALELTTRNCIRPRAGPFFGKRLREDLKEAQAQHEAMMQAKGAELIYVAKGDEGYAPTELIRVPYQLGWLPGGLLALPDDVPSGKFDEAARLAARVLGFEPFLNLPVNDRRNDDGDALLAVDDLAEDEVLFSEFAGQMGSREFRRRVRILAANGVSDFVAPTWRKIDKRSGYAVDRFSPFNAGADSPLEVPDEWLDEFPSLERSKAHPDLSKMRRERSDHVQPDLSWTGWSVSYGPDISVDELRAIAQALYRRG